MMYKVPRPSRSNGVRLHTLGDHEIGIEYTEGEPHVGAMAYDSAYGITSKITFRRRRPDYEAIVADAVRQVAAEDAAMPRAEKPRSLDMKTETMEYDDDASKVISTLLDYLEKYLDPDQMDGVVAILGNGEKADNDTVGEPHNYQATDRRGRRPTAWGADDQARRRPMSGRVEAEYSAMFPHAHRLA